MDTRLLEHDEFKPLLISLLIFGVLMGCFVWYETGKTTRETLKQENIALAQAEVRNLLFGRPGKFPSIATRYEPWESVPSAYLLESYLDVAGERKPYVCFVANNEEHVRGATCGFLGQEIQKDGIYVAGSCGYAEIPQIDKPLKYSFDNIWPGERVRALERKQPLEKRQIRVGDEWATQRTDLVYWRVESVDHPRKSKVWMDENRLFAFKR